MPTIRQLLENVNVGEANVFNVTTALTPAGKDDGLKLEVISRKVAGEEPRAPVRKESPPRDHMFFDIEGFASYVSKYGSRNTVVFADPSESIISCVLDDKAAKGFETVSYSPLVHPLFRPWQDISSSGNRVTLDFFADFVSSNRRSIVDPAGRDLVLLLAQVKAVVTKEIHRGRGAKSVNGLICKTMVAGVQKDELVELPETIKIFTPLFVGGGKREVEIDVNLGVSEEGEIEVWLACGDLLSVKADEFDQALYRLKTYFEKSASADVQVTISLGGPGHGEWEYLPEIK